VPLRVVGGLTEINEHKQIQDRLVNADELGNLAQSLTEVSSGLQQTTEEALNVSAAATETMEGLDSSQTQIESIVGLIAGIADKTKLLALNAAIEAARAGDAGRGFDVVAKEVGDLAERTAQSTKDISATVSSTRNDAQTATAAVQQMATVVDAIDTSQRAILQVVEELHANTAGGASTGR
jgi:methyl-accepting chemotaxis protein